MPNQHTAYSEQETAWLRAHYRTATKAEILAAVPGREWTVIQNQASKLGVTGRPKFVPLKQVSTWCPATTALLRAHYPTGGSAVVTGLTGISRTAVRSAAARLKLEYIAKEKRPKAAKPPKAVPAPRVRAPQAAKTPKPVAPPLPMKPARISTPVLNAAVSKRRLAARPSVAITAQEVSKLPYSHGGRMAYMNDGARGWERWQQSQQRP